MYFIKFASWFYKIRNEYEKKPRRNNQLLPKPRVNASVSSLSFFYSKIEMNCRDNKRVAVHFSYIVGFILMGKPVWRDRGRVCLNACYCHCTIMFNQEWRQLRCSGLIATWFDDLRPYYARIFSSTKSIITLFCSSSSLQVNICCNLFVTTNPRVSTTPHSRLYSLEDYLETWLLLGPWITVMR